MCFFLHLEVRRYLISCYQLPCSEIPGFQDVLPFSFFPYTARANPGWICPIQHYIIAHPCGFGKRWFWGSALYWPGSGVGSGVMCPGPGRGSLHPTCQKISCLFWKMRNYQPTRPVSGPFHVKKLVVATWNRNWRGTISVSCSVPSNTFSLHFFPPVLCMWSGYSRTTSLK